MKGKKYRLEKMPEMKMFKKKVTDTRKKKHTRREKRHKQTQNNVRKRKKKILSSSNGSEPEIEIYKGSVSALCIKGQRNGANRSHSCCVLCTNAHIFACVRRKFSSNTQNILYVFVVVFFYIHRLYFSFSETKALNCLCLSRFSSLFAFSFNRCSFSLPSLQSGVQ